MELRRDLGDKKSDTNLWPLGLWLLAGFKTQALPLVPSTYLLVKQSATILLKLPAFEMLYSPLKTI